MSTFTLEQLYEFLTLQIEANRVCDRELTWMFRSKAAAAVTMATTLAAALADTRAKPQSQEGGQTPKALRPLEVQRGKEVKSRT